MKKTLSTLVGVGILAGVLTITNGHAQQVVNIVADGNLAPVRDTPLQSLEQATSKDTPVDFVDLMVQLVKAGDYEQAAKAFAVAMTYGEYDTMRVEDQTAHQGITVLVMTKFGDLSESQTQALQEQVDKLLRGGGAGAITLLTRLGKPSYHPRYLIQHGIKAFSSPTGDGLVKGFDGDSAWKVLLEKF